MVRSPLLLSSNDRLARWVILGLAMAPVIAAFFYNQGLRVPLMKCFFQSLFGFPSPTCGMTRAFMALARGDLQQAITYHLFAPVVFGICVLTVGHAGFELSTGRVYTPIYTGLLHKPWLMVVSLLLFMGYYALRLYACYSDGTLPFALSELYAWQLLVDGAKAL